MLSKNAAGVITCKEHAELETTNQRIAYAHLRLMHPALVELVERIEITRVEIPQTREERRKAAHKARRQSRRTPNQGGTQ